MSAYVAPEERALSRATAARPSICSGSGAAASARRTANAPGTISQAAMVRADVPQERRNSLRVGRLIDRGFEPRLSRSRMREGYHSSTRESTRSSAFGGLGRFRTEDDVYHIPGVLLV